MFNLKLQNMQFKGDTEPKLALNRKLSQTVRNSFIIKLKEFVEKKYCIIC